MILGNSGGQNMVQPSGGGGGGGALNRLFDVISRNQNLAQITHGVNETTRGMNERNSNSTNQLLRVMRLGQMTHGETHPDTIQEGLPNEGTPHPLAGQSTGNLKGTSVHPVLAHHIKGPGIQAAFGFKFGSQYTPYQKPDPETPATATGTASGKKKRRK